MKSIDLNCDMGEGFGPWKMGDDEAVMPFITSANIACGAHAGDPDVMLATIRLAKKHGVAVGAHPGYFDLRNFGRLPATLTSDQVAAMLIYQVGACAGLAGTEGLEIHHIKPHGALYNQACTDRELAKVIAISIARFSKTVPLVGLPNSYMEEAAAASGIPYRREGFADRAYEPNGLLRDRNHPDALLKDPDAAARNAVSLAGGQVTAVDGSVADLIVDTICVHGDTPGAPQIARRVRERLEEAGFAVRSP
jgi:UPF0271 protein